MELADGATDIFIVVPQQYFRMSAPFLRLWMALPTTVAHRCPPERGILVYLDEMASIGYLDPVVDSFTMAAGSGVHYWCFVQTLSTLDASYGRDARAVILENAEVVQALGFPRYAPELAAEFARAIGHATFLGRQDSRSDSIANGPAGSSRDQSGASEGLVKETVIAPDDLLRLPEGEQIVIAEDAARRAQRHASAPRPLLDPARLCRAPEPGPARGAPPGLNSPAAHPTACGVRHVQPASDWCPVPLLSIPLTPENCVTEINSCTNYAIWPISLFRERLVDHHIAQSSC